MSAGVAREVRAMGARLLRLPAVEARAPLGPWPLYRRIVVDPLLLLEAGLGGCAPATERERAGHSRGIPSGGATGDWPPEARDVPGESAAVSVPSLRATRAGGRVGASVPRGVPHLRSEGMRDARQGPFATEAAPPAAGAAARWPHPPGQAAVADADAAWGPGHATTVPARQAAAPAEQPRAALEPPAPHPPSLAACAEPVPAMRDEDIGGGTPAARVVPLRTGPRQAAEPGLVRAPALAEPGGREADPGSPAGAARIPARAPAGDSPATAPAHAAPPLEKGSLALTREPARLHALLSAHLDPGRPASRSQPRDAGTPPTALPAFGAAERTAAADEAQPPWPERRAWPEPDIAADEAQRPWPERRAWPEPDFAAEDALLERLVDRLELALLRAAAPGEV